ncbi:MAG TPA: hypothetical protein VMT64_15575 [Candidatus Binataceae bacterium]|nr:hypothetical protein [Candidatus Binataceae bacterium]
MAQPQDPNRSSFEEAAERQVETKPFPHMTPIGARNVSLLLAAALVLPAVGIALFAFETSRLVLGFSTVAILLGVWVAYYLILHGILKRRRQM